MARIENPAVIEKVLIYLDEKDGTFAESTPI